MKDGGENEKRESLCKATKYEVLMKTNIRAVQNEKKGGERKGKRKYSKISCTRGNLCTVLTHSVHRGWERGGGSKGSPEGRRESAKQQTNL